MLAMALLRGLSSGWHQLIAQALLTDPKRTAEATVEHCQVPPPAAAVLWAAVVAHAGWGGQELFSLLRGTAVVAYLDFFKEAGPEDRWPPPPPPPAPAAAAAARTARRLALA